MIEPTLYQVEPHYRVGFSVDLTIFTVHEGELKVLLIKKKEQPYEGFSALPGDLVNTDVEAFEAAHALARNFTSAPDFYCKQIKAFTNPERHPGGRVITIAYLVALPYDKVSLKENALYNEMEWAPVNELPILPFDHGAIIRSGVIDIQNKIHYQPLVFNLISEEFSITEIRQAYEAILNEKIDIRNFSKRVKQSGFIYPLEKFSKKGKHGGRKARLYRFMSKDFEMTKSPSQYFIF